MSQNINLRRVDETEANIYSNLQDQQWAFNSDTNDLIIRNGSSYYHFPAYKYYDGSDNFLNVTFNDLTVNNDLTADGVFNLGPDTDTGMAFPAEGEFKLNLDDTPVIYGNNFRIGIRKQYPNSWLHIGGSASFAITQPSGANINVDDTMHVLVLDTSSADVTLHLPTAVSITGREYVIKNYSGSNSVIVAPTTGETLETQTAFHIATAGRAWPIMAHEGNWIML